MIICQISTADNQAISELIAELLERYQLPCNDSFLENARAYAARLPFGVIESLNQFRFREDHDGTFLVRGFSIDNEQLERTPDAVGKEVDENSAPREGFLLVLLASFLGDPMAWADQRSGAILNNILPLKNHETEQLSTGSLVDLDWHSEEAFHPFRADFLALMCLRNPDAIPTTVCSISSVTVPDEIKKILFQPRFVFHTDKNFVQEGEEVAVLAEPVLFGDFNSPYVRLDPSFMSAQEGDAEAAEALQYIINTVGRSMQNVPLEPGDVVFLDNYRVVHGRKAFKPRFDGNDRWLKRINIALDLRKSRAKRPSATSRVIETY